jgi:hypothetical protein
MDDENINAINNNALIEQLKQTHYKCQSNNKYIPQTFINNQRCDCEDTKVELCEDEYSDIDYLQNNILFQHICDDFIDLLPIMIGEKNETDETECEQWKCSNIYTRCNGIWNCPNGADETGCSSRSTLHCSLNFHLCVSRDTYQLICLPTDKANDGNVDCLGATDEPTLCGTKIRSIYRQTTKEFYCRNYSYNSCVSSLDLCDGTRECEYGDDEQFCTTNRTLPIQSTICIRGRGINSSDVEQFLCNYKTPFQ